MSDSCRHLITPRDEFSVLCTDTCTSRSTKLTVFSRFSAWVFLEHSTKKDPSLGALEGSGYCLETLLHREGRQLAQRPLFTRRLNHDKPRSVILCEKKLIVRVQVRVIISSCFFCVFFFFFCFLEKPRKLYLEGR